MKVHSQRDGECGGERMRDEGERGEEIGSSKDEKEDWNSGKEVSKKAIAEIQLSFILSFLLLVFYLMKAKEFLVLAITLDEMKWVQNMEVAQIRIEFGKNKRFQTFQVWFFAWLIVTCTLWMWTDSFSHITLMIWMKKACVFEVSYPNLCQKTTRRFFTFVPLAIAKLETSQSPKRKKEREQSIIP